MSSISPCPRWRDLLPAYHDHELPPRTMQQVAAHLAECAACAATVQQFEHDRTRFVATFAESAGTDALRATVLEEIRMTSPMPNIKYVPLVRYRWLAAVTGLATAAAILLAGVILLKIDLFPQPQVTASIEEKVPIVTPQTPRATYSTVDATNGAAAAAPAMPLTSTKAAGVRTSEEPSQLAHEVGMTTARDSYKAFNAFDSRGDQGEKSKLDYANTLTANPTLSAGGELNYGVPGGVRMSYDVDYQLQVKHALSGAREAQRLIRKRGGYTIDFQYSAEKGKPPTASFTGKIPAKEAEYVLEDIEKLGTVRSLNIAGTDITDEIRWRQDELKHQQGSIADETKRELVDLGLQHTLVAFSASFVEPMPPAPMTMHRAADVTKNVLKYALLCAVTLAVILLGVTLIAAPILALRAWRRRKQLPLNAPEEYAPTE